MAVIINYVLCLTLLLYSCEAYKALIVTQMPSKSHAILNEPIVRQLLKGGNEVTYIRSRQYKNPPPTLREIDVSSNEEAVDGAFINIKSIMDTEIELNEHESIYRLMTTLGIKTLENKDVQKLINDPKEHFDVVIIEFMESDILASFAAVFDCPLIWLSPIEVNSDILSRIDVRPNPAYIVDAMSFSIAPLSFPERIAELWYRLKTEYLKFRYIDDMHEEAYNRLITPAISKRGRVPPSFEDVRRNVSLVLGYSHASMGESVNLPQSYKSVGGYHIDEDAKPLPEDLQKLMDNAKDGVIYFSMGSNLKSAEWPEEIKTNMVKMLGGLKQTVLWKFEEQLPNTPKNVYISDWFPQFSIISHPNCVLFITHGGLLSMAEALHVGIPVIGIPGFGDQFVNIKRVELKGYGLKVGMTYNVVEDLKKAVDKMTSNASYRQKAKEWSFVFHDRIVKPIEELSFWVDHVVQTRGAPHLRSPILNQPLYQILYLDLAAIILAVSVIIVKLLRFVCISICSSKKLEKKNRSEKKKK